MAKYTKVENVRMTISLLKAHGIRHIVVSPGGTNIPIVQGLQQDPFFHLYSVVDERSAMYFAIGLYMEVREPIATTCTSAQATRNYIPGLTEAYYKRVPILAITHSKHDRFTYQEIMQAPNQISLPEDSVKHSYSLPYISNTADRLMCTRLINEAILELTRNSLGPVQLNIPITDSERLSFIETELPIVRTIKRYESDEVWDISLSGKKVMIIVGEHILFSNVERELIERFVKSHNAIVYTNHLSNLHADCEISGNLLVTSISQALFNEVFAPDILITIGGQTGDYSIFGKISNNKTLQHWRVCTDGKVVDTYDKLTKVFQCTILQFFSNLINIDTCQDNLYLKLWQDANSTIRRDDVELPLSNIYVAQQLHNLIPPGSSMVFAILNSLRSWMMFPLDKSINCYAPVSAFGIDGGMSMAIGQAYTSQKLSFFVTGDLAFFYDMNSLGIRGLGNNIRIILINNNRGAEFALYGNPNKIDLSTYISAENHNGEAAGWCRANGFEYISASTKAQVLEHCHTIVSYNEKPIVFEVFTKSEDEASALKILVEENFRGTVIEERKNRLKALLGDTIINLILEITGK